MEIPREIVLQRLKLNYFPEGIKTIKEANGEVHLVFDNNCKLSRHYSYGLLIKAKKLPYSLLLRHINKFKNLDLFQKSIWDDYTETQKENLLCKNFTKTGRNLHYFNDFSFDFIYDIMNKNHGYIDLRGADFSRFTETERKKLYTIYILNFNDTGLIQKLSFELEMAIITKLKKILSVDYTVKSFNYKKLNQSSLITQTLLFNSLRIKKYLSYLLFIHPVLQLKIIKSKINDFILIKNPTLEAQEYFKNNSVEEVKNKVILEKNKIRNNLKDRLKNKNVVMERKNLNLTREQKISIIQQHPLTFDQIDQMDFELALLASKTYVIPLDKILEKTQNLTQEQEKEIIINSIYYNHNNIKHVKNLTRELMISILEIKLRNNYTRLEIIKKINFDLLFEDINLPEN